MNVHAGGRFVGRNRIAVAAVAGLLPAFQTQATVLFDDISAYQAGKPNASATYTTNTPNTFMGDGYTLISGATDITGMDVFPVNESGTNYNGLEVSIYIWGTVNTGTVSGTTPAFSNLLGAYGVSFSGSYNNGNVYSIQQSPAGISPGVSFNTPLQLNGVSTVGVTVSFEGTTGSGYSTANKLTSLISYGVAPTTGSEVFNGYYRNANSETNGDFTSTLRNLGYADQSLALRIYGDVSTSADQWSANSSGDWATAANWSTASAPTSTTDAVLNTSTPSTYTVTVSSSDVCKDLYVQAGNPTLDLSVGGSALAITDSLAVGPSASNGSGNVTLSLTHSFGGAPINISAGSIAVGGSGESGTLNIGTGVRLVSTSAINISGGSSVVIFRGGKIVAPAVNIAGNTDAWTGILDIGTSALDLPSENLVTATNQVKQGFNLAGNANWNGTGGITSSAASADTTQLTAVGVISNNDGSDHPLYGTGGSLGMFGTSDPGLNDVLIRPTYFGDANLDGKVDGSDYSRIDYGALNSLTGWYNGDFNYDGVINGSDYTLIDNAFNTQGAEMIADPAVEPATNTADLPNAFPTAVFLQSKGTSVPEPSRWLPLFAISPLLRISRRNRKLKRTTAQFQ